MPLKSYQVPNKGGLVRGAVVSLNAQQLELLDGFERGYVKTKLMATIQRPGNNFFSEQVRTLDLLEGRWSRQGEGGVALVLISVCVSVGVSPCTCAANCQLQCLFTSLSPSPLRVWIQWWQWQWQ